MNLPAMIGRVTLGVLVFPALAQAATVTFCLRHTGEYEDSSEVDDFWPTNEKKLAGGAEAAIYRGNTRIFPIDLDDPYLGDGFGGTSRGCTPPLTFPDGAAVFRFWVFSKGMVAANSIVVTNQYDAVGYIYNEISYTFVGSPAPKKVELTVPYGSAFKAMNVYQAAAWAMYRHDGGTNWGEIHYVVHPSLGPWYCDNSDPPIDKCPFGSNSIMIADSSNRTRLKYLIAHELGHWIADVRTQGVMDSDPADYDVWTEECPSDRDYSLTSEEWAGAAQAEGFGRFYAGDVYNSHDEDDCFYPLLAADGTLTGHYDCEFGSEEYPVRWHEQVCGGDDEHGVILDWHRALWDVHTNGAAPDPSFTSIMDWMDEAGNWTKANVYDVLQTASVGRGDLQTNWDWAKVANGVTH